MTDEKTDPAAEVAGEADEQERRRLRAEVFGDVLPESTSDDRDVVVVCSEEWMRREWLKRQVPPHHGG